MKYLVTALVGAIIGAGLSWHFRPVKTVVKIEEREVVREVVKVVEKKAANVVTKRVVEAKPDGTTVTHETIEDRSIIDFKLTADRTEAKETLVEKRTRTFAYNWKLSAGVGVNPLGNLSQPYYLFSAERRIMGPLAAGVFGISNREHHIVGVLASWTF